MRRPTPLLLGIFLLAAAFVACPPAGQPRAQDTLRAAAVVNDEVISVLDLVMRTRLAVLASGLKNTNEARNRLREQVLRGLIDERLQVQEADRLDISVDESQLETAIKGLAGRNNMTSDQFLQLLAQNQILPTALRNQIRSELTWQTVIQRRLRPTIEISDEEVDEFIGRFESRSGSVQLRVSEILLSVDSADQEQKVQEAAKRLTEELRNGASFAELARQFSQSATASVAGDLGWVQEAQLPDELDQALAQMQPGQVRGPIRTFGGYYLLWLRDRRQVSVGDATVDLRQLLFPLPANATQAQFQKAQTQASGAQPRIQGCDQIDAVAAELGLPGAKNLGTIKLSDLPPNIRKIVATLPIGLASEPIPISAGVSLLVICARENGGVDRELIRDSLVNQRLDLLSRRYLRDLRKAANVDIRL